MAGKYHYISALAEMTAADIVKNENEWTRFLTTAARLYKLCPKTGCNSLCFA